MSEEPSQHNNVTRFSEFPLTEWTVILSAARRQDGDAQAREAQDRLLKRYEKAIRSYLYAGLRSEDEVDDVFQELAVRLASGKFAGVDPQRGKFRTYLKTTLSHLITDRRKLRVRRPASFEEVPHEPADPAEPPADSDDIAFLRAWRKALLKRAWMDLKEYERREGKPYYTLLKYRIANEGARSRDMAARFGSLLGRNASEEGVRRLLHRARDEFADLLLDAVAQTLQAPSLPEIENEMIELDLHQYVKRALDRRLRANGRA